MNRDEFTEFCKPLIRRHEGLLSLEWLPSVSIEERAEFEHNLQQATGSTAGIVEMGSRRLIKTAGVRPHYWPVEFLVQSQQTPSSALGFDHASHAPRWEALKTACDTGEPAATERLTLFRIDGSEPERSGMLVAMPVYRNGTAVETAAERRQNLQGYVVAVFQLDSVVRWAVTALAPAEIEFALLDTAADPAAQTLTVYPPSAALGIGNNTPDRADGNAVFAKQRNSLRFAQRDWTMVAAPNDTYLASHDTSLPNIVLAAGLIITAALAAFLKQIIGRQAQVKSQVVQRTAELQAARDELERLTRHDHLTGLLNRRAMQDELRREWQRATRNGTPLSCAVLDADYFKKVNDTYGHAAGDEVLRVVADLLRASCRATDAVARYGGEEFCVILPDASESQAAEWSDRLRKQIEATVISLTGQSIQVTVSFGVAEKLEDTSSGDQLVEHADQALLVAKQRGRNQVVAYSQLNCTGQGELLPDDVFVNAVATDVMTPLVCWLDHNDSIEEAVELLIQTRLETLPVLSVQGELIGLFGEEDVTAQLLTLRDWRCPVVEHLRRKPVCFDVATPVRQIAQFLGRAALRRVAVVEGGRFVGMISRGGLLRWHREATTNGKVCRVAAVADSGHVSPAMIRVIEQLEREPRRLREGLVSSASDIDPQIIATASRMQDLIEQLLSQLRAEPGPHEGHSCSFDQVLA